jgi:Rod binding domain-containing protein
MSGLALAPQVAGIPRESPDAAGIPLAGKAAAEPTSAPKTSGKGIKDLDPKLVKAAQEFEAVFIRQLLKPLEKAGEMGKSGPVTSGSSVYGSMMVGAMADSASKGGGIGLAEMVLKALTDAGKAVPKSEPEAGKPGEAKSPSPLNQNKIKSL